MPETAEPTPSSALPSFDRILLVTDFSECSNNAVPFARLLDSYYRAKVIVVHVVATEADARGGAKSPAEIEEARKTAEAQVQEFIAQNHLSGIVSDTVIAAGPVWEAIAAVVDERRIDLIVLGTRGRTGVGKLLMGSVAQRIFSLAPCPVLSVSPRAQKTWGPDDRLSRLLYATDFSPNSLKALPYALSLAKVSGAELLLLHAPNPSEAASPEIDQGYHQHLNALIPPEHKSWCRSDTLVSRGDAAHVILDTATKYNVDFIVIGGHAVEGALSPFQVPLTTAYQVVARAHCPVLRVRS